MLKTFREKSQSLVIIMFVFIISFVFIVQFGPQQQGCGAAGATYAATVEGESISETQFRALYRLKRTSYGDLPEKTARAIKLRESTLDALIDRTLLAHEAERRGFRIARDEPWDVFFSNAIYLPEQGRLRVNFADDNGEFSKGNFRMFVQGRLKLPETEFLRMQREEMLADRMREAIASGVRVGERELRDEYARKSLKVTVRYARFRPSYFGDSTRPAPGELNAWMQAHEADVGREYERGKAQFSKSERRVRVRHVLISAPENVSEAERARARAKAEEVLAELRAGADLATVARGKSDDPGSRYRGGDLGWVVRGRTVPPFEQAAFALALGQISGVVETRFGYHILKCEGVSEGPMPEAEARREIATEMWRRDRAPELARQAAQEALQRLRAGQALDAIAADVRRRVEGSSRELSEGEQELAPLMRETPPFGRSGQPIPGASEQAAFVRAALDLTRQSPVPSEPLRMGDEYVVLQLTERVEPSDEEFDRQRATLVRDLLAQKRREAVGSYVDRLKAIAEANNEIRRNPAVLTYEGIETPEPGESEPGESGESGEEGG